MTELNRFFIGTASWNIPATAKVKFSSVGTHLQKYSQVLNGVEINSSFYRNHKSETYKKWADSTPDDFRFSVKLLKNFTHLQKLKGPYSELAEVLAGIQNLSNKLSVLLVQLPPSLALSIKDADTFFAKVREDYSGSVLVEPRHLSWLSEESKLLFKKYALGKVLADPEPCPAKDKREFQYASLLYYRLHGSPEIYKSNYTHEYLNAFSTQFLNENPTKPKWCIFDNTTFGYATHNAIELTKKINLERKLPELSKVPTLFSSL